jgi:hypothetical protein
VDGVADAAHPREFILVHRAFFEGGQGVRVITRLQHPLKHRRAQRRAAVQPEIRCFENHRARLDYAEAQHRGEPPGSGAMESTCRRYPCRFQRPGQFWTTTGDEALMRLESFWRNGRWNRLFLHLGNFDPSKN